MSRVVVLLVLLLGACSASPDPPEAGGTATAPPSPRLRRPRPPSRARRPPPYSASVRPIGPALRNRMRYSHGPGCPVPLEDLRYLRMSYVGFDGAAAHRRDGRPPGPRRAVTGVFERLYDARWPIQRMRLVDDYRGDDDRSMAANNTSGYNCRRVAGSDSWSAHAYGAAIDINPVQNPYVTGTSVAPPAAGGSRPSTGPHRAHVPPARSGQATSSSGPSPGSAGSGAATGRRRRTTSTSRPQTAER